MRLRRILTALISTTFIAAPFLVLWQHQNMYDWWILRSYTAPAEIVKLAENTTMNEYGQKVFYVARPILQAKQDFKFSCDLSEKTIVLGCYKSGSGIYIYKVTDERLNGVQEVTAAHEMLHAAYDRLDGGEKKRVDQLISETYYKLTNERIKKNVEAYRTKDAFIVPNELHSILGTEVKNLSPELEIYYKQYFTDRLKVVGYSEQYEAEFSSRANQVESYDIQLKQLKADIDSLNSSLAAQGRAIDTESSRMEALLKDRKISEYNAAIPGYRQLITAYNNDVSRLRSKISTYNLIIEQRNSVVTEEQELFEAIDTRTPSTR